MIEVLGFFRLFRVARSGRSAGRKSIEMATPPASTYAEFGRPVCRQALAEGYNAVSSLGSDGQTVPLRVHGHEAQVAFGLWKLSALLV